MIASPTPEPPRPPSPPIGPLGANPESYARLKPEAQWEVDQGQGLTGPQVYAASVARTLLPSTSRCGAASGAGAVVPISSASRA